MLHHGMADEQVKLSAFEELHLGKMNARHTILDSNLARAHDKHTSFPRNL
jgi:hypothetical protein